MARHSTVDRTAGTAPRLLVLASTYPGRADDGTPSFVADLAAAEADHFETLVLVPSVPGAERMDVAGSVRVHRFRYFPRRHETLADGAILENLRAARSRWLQVLPFFLGELIALRIALRRFRPDVLHLHWLLPQGLVALLTRPRVPWLLTCHGADVYALRGPLSRRLKRAVLRRATAISTVNQDMRDRLIALGADPQRVHVLPMPAARLAPEAGSAVIERATARPVPGRVVFVGRLVEKKGVAVLLDALQLLPATAQWTCQILGDGPLRGQLEQLATPLTGKVEFLGQVGKARVQQALTEAAIVVVPSVAAASGDQDGLPVTLLEAMTRGRTVVASRLPGITDVLVDGVNGLLVPPGEAAALATALERLLTEPASGRAIGASAAITAEEFSVDRLGRRYVSLLRSLLPTDQ